MNSTTDAPDAPAPPPVDTNIFLACVLTLVLLTGAEGFVLGWGLNMAAARTSHIELQPDHLLAFIKWILVVFTPLILINIGVGVYIARRLSAPLHRMRMAMSAIALGNLEYTFEIPPRELLQAYTLDCQTMLLTLRRLIYRDYNSAVQAEAYLDECRQLLAAPSPDHTQLTVLLNKARSELSVINYHFTKGRRSKV
jgi:nitrogen fixation/metabolism regulation signal transduction histidine kinase